jgi:hypothetical protein
LVGQPTQAGTIRFLKINARLSHTCRVACRVQPGAMSETKDTFR